MKDPQRIIQVTVESNTDERYRVQWTERNGVARAPRRATRTRLTECNEGSRVIGASAMLIGCNIDGDAMLHIYGNTSNQWSPVFQSELYSGYRVSTNSCKKHVYVSVCDTLYYGWRHGRGPEYTTQSIDHVSIAEFGGAPWGITLHANGRKSTMTSLEPSGDEPVSFDINEYLSEPLVTDRYNTYIASHEDSEVFTLGLQYVDCAGDSDLRPSGGVATDGVIYVVCRDRAFPSTKSVMTRRDLREAEPVLLHDINSVEVSDKWLIASMGDTLLMNATSYTYFVFDSRNMSMYEYGLDDPSVKILGYQQLN